MPTINRQTVGAGKTHASLDAALTANASRNLVSLDEILEFEVYASASENARATTFTVANSIVTGINNYIRIYPAPGEGHTGYWDTSKFYLRFNQNVAGVSMAANYCRIEQFQIECTANDVTTTCYNTANTPTAGAGTATRQYFINCIVKAISLGGVTAGALRGFYMGSNANADAKIIYINCLAYDLRRMFSSSFGFNNQTVAGTQTYYYNCTAVNSETGFRNRDTAHHKNCVAIDCEDGYTTSSTAPGDTDYNFSSRRPDTGNDAVGVVGTNAKDGVAALMLDAPNDDFRPDSGPSDLKDAGINLTADANFPFNFDITVGVNNDAGRTRTANRPASGPWTVGAFEAPATVVQNVRWIWSGAVTVAGARVKARLNIAEETAVVNLKVSVNSDLSSAATFGPVTATAANQHMATFDLSGLTPDTTYYYAVEIGGATYATGPRKGQFRTLMVPGAASYVVAFSSCYEAQSGSAEVFDSIVSHNPRLFFHLGDLHYHNITTNDAALFRNAYEHALLGPGMQRLSSSTSIVYTWDDHCYGNSNSDSTSVARPAAEAVYRAYVPHHPLREEEAGHDPIYHAFVMGRIRYIVTDLRSNRSPRNNTDNASKTMMGATQKQWFKDQCLAAKESGQVIVWACSVPWVFAPTTNDDSWGGYTTERTELSDFFKTNNITNLLRIGGDAHSIQADDGTNDLYATSAPHPQHATFHASPLSQSTALKGGPYSHGQFENRGQFGVLTITDTGTTTITIVFSGRQQMNTQLVTVTKNFTVPLPGENLYMVNSSQGGTAHGLLQVGGTPPTSTVTGTGWEVANVATANFSRMAFGTERAQGTFGGTAEPSSGPDNTIGDCFRTSSPLAGSFSAGIWTFNVPVRALDQGGTQDGRIRVRLWKSASPTGMTPTELTSGTVVLSTVTDLATGVSQTSTGTVVLGAFSLSNEYLFVQLAWEITD